ncbi:hypothetical protein WG66_009457 [Moniliophthora roreri]|nr:hypothetical protein WG66_009457 [Moniliophthora roreri]
MVTTRSQTAKRHQPTRTKATPRRSARIALKDRKPISSSRKGKGKAAPMPRLAHSTKTKNRLPAPRPKSAAGKRVRLVTPLPDGDAQRSWPSTPNAPRKPTQSLPRPVLKPDLPAHLSASPSSFDEETMTPTPTVSNFHARDRMLIRDETPLLGSPSPHEYPHRHIHLSPNDICNSIPGTWHRSPNSCTRRLVIIPDDVSVQAEYERELKRQKRYDKIFKEQYDLLMQGKEESDRKVREMLARRRVREADAMDCN